LVFSCPKHKILPGKAQEELDQGDRGNGRRTFGCRFAEIERRLWIRFFVSGDYPAGILDRIAETAGGSGPDHIALLVIDNPLVILQDDVFTPFMIKRCYVIGFSPINNDRYLRTSFSEGFCCFGVLWTRAAAFWKFRVFNSPERRQVMVDWGESRDGALRLRQSPGLRIVNPHGIRFPR
jgi:hypothetical protein